MLWYFNMRLVRSYPHQDFCLFIGVYYFTALIRRNLLDVK